MIEKLSIASSNNFGSNSTSSLLWDINSRVWYLIEPTHIGKDLVFFLDEKKVGIIEYTLNLDKKICYISFFGTQNGLKEKDNYKKLSILDPLIPWEKPKRDISFSIIHSFIETVSYPNNLEMIYLDFDSMSNKVFWKDKVGKYFLNNWMFTRVSSSGFEVCFTLSSNK